jgi:hypothetical protein
MDAYSSYNQIPMFEGDRDKNVLMTEHANYGYNIMYCHLG